eukprot:CAMPEP_0171305612 /NCGR_PEP_ID=MMETSP0816-20121228/15498_1 /TAXON_ID=420281 /ORGANISM="Proboscia inermis, Strain CCAP1064/1" /LENGTH=242 /DNA_ID=CAMNT_0011786593 /DNA_START=160 /DNA_END=888 /DNA_ORIENTATION=-
MLKTTIISVTILLIAWKRAFFITCFRSLNISRVQGQLDRLSEMGIPGLIAYSVAFAVWEITVGVTTPVETAAGMAFGVKRGIIASASGKIGGAITAYFLGRYILRDYVKLKLEKNEMMELVKKSIETNPLRVALIWRFSCLPEFVKNFGLSILPLKSTHFIAAAFLHGFPFTCLWTCLGAEAGLLARGVVTKPSRALQTMIGGVYIFGFIVSPAVVGLWVKGLKDQQSDMLNEDKHNITNIT